MLVAYMVEQGLNPAKTPLTVVFAYLEHVEELYDAIEEEA
jgi:hypothetical protein